MVRQASVERKTGETNIAVTLNLDVAPGEKQAISVSTGVGFLDHVSRLWSGGTLRRGVLEWIVSTHGVTLSSSSLESNALRPSHLLT